MNLGTYDCPSPVIIPEEYSILVEGIPSVIDGDAHWASVLKKMDENNLVIPLIITLDLSNIPESIQCFPIFPIPEVKEGEIP